MSPYSLSKSSHSDGVCYCVIEANLLLETVENVKRVFTLVGIAIGAAVLSLQIIRKYIFQGAYCSTLTIYDLFRAPLKRNSELIRLNWHCYQHHFCYNEILWLTINNTVKAQCIN